MDLKEQSDEHIIRALEFWEDATKNGKLPYPLLKQAHGHKRRYLKEYNTRFADIINS